MKDVHLTFPEGTLRRLTQMARRLKVKRTSLVRDAVEHYLSHLEQEQLAREMAAYAEEMGEGSGQFVEESGTEVDRLLVEETEW